MFLSIVFCSLLDFTNWLQNYLLPCPFKKLTGIDCPGCGFQRSIMALINGNLMQSLQLYPAAIPILITTIFVVLAIKFKFDNYNLIKKTLYLITGSIIIASYIYKMHQLYI